MLVLFNDMLVYNNELEERLDAGASIVYLGGSPANTIDPMLKRQNNNLAVMTKLNWYINR